MYITMRSMDGQQKFLLSDISRCTPITDLRILLQEKLKDKPNPERQRLFFRGKLMVDGHTLFDYGVTINDVVLFMIKPEELEKLGVDDFENTKKNDKENECPLNFSEEKSEINDDKKSTYKDGDQLDVRDPCMGAWFEVEVLAVRRQPENVQVVVPKLPERLHEIGHDDGYAYQCRFLGEPDVEVTVSCRHLRPRARSLRKPKDLCKDQLVLVNYNYEEPTKRGYFYDFIVDSSTCGANKTDPWTVKGTLFVGAGHDGELVAMSDVQLHFLDEIFDPEAVVEGAFEKSALETPLRQTKANCTRCGDNPRRKCRECGCAVCGGKDAQDKQIMCDECDQPYHLWCLTPPLQSLPEEDDWYCPQCRNDSEVVLPGEGLKVSNKKRASSVRKTDNGNVTASSRDWGKGFACSGRSKICALVPSNHLGPIPGVEVGSSWLFRLQVSEAGVHRPHVAGIHGGSTGYAYSLVLSGGYEDDVDNGDEFFYTGSGGRDLSGNKRTAEQSCDQLLTRMNKALAQNCASASGNKLNDIDGGDAGDNWREGKPVRVVRNYKAAKHSKYAPTQGNRYDGVYKVVKYWPVKGRSGFRVWRYLLRRDDPTPAPWTEDGKRRIADLGLIMELPDGYEEQQKLLQEKKEQNALTVNLESEKRGHKRKHTQCEDVEEVEVDNLDVKASQKKLKKGKNGSLPNVEEKTNTWSVAKEIVDLVAKDVTNSSTWKNLMEQSITLGAQGWRRVVQETFTCVCCQEVLLLPVSTSCGHNTCSECLLRSRRAGITSCPWCRHDLGDFLSADGALPINHALQKVLSAIFPAYEKARE